MSTELNASDLSAERYHDSEDTGIEGHFQDGCRAGYLWAIKEVAQPIADERDELREALERIEKLPHDKPGTTPQTCGGCIARAILAKYPKP